MAPPFYEPVSLSLPSGILLLGDRVEVLQGCGGSTGARITLKKGTYRILYKPALLLIIKDTCTRDQADDFIRTINPMEDAYMNPDGPLVAEAWGRMGHAMSGFAEEEDAKENDWKWYQDGVYVACDEQTDKASVCDGVTKSSVDKSRAEQHVISFASGMGIAVDTLSEYKYLVTAGKEMVASLGYEACDEEVDEIIGELNKVWPRHVTKAAIE